MTTTGSVPLDERVGPRFSSSKLTAPRASRSHLARPELCARLDGADEGALTLVVGSPGAGKTALLAEWHRRQPEDSVAWVNVDVGDRDPDRFWRALVAAVDRCAPGFAQRPLDLLRLAPTVEHEVLEGVLQSMSELPRAVSVVLDDLQHAGSEVERQLGFVVSRGTGALRVLVGARSEPQVGLPRLRVDGRVLEIRDADLTFGVDAASRLLAGLGIELERSLVERVVSRTEGWAAGLQLAGLALANCDDVEALVDRLAGTNKVIAHYLWSEVFAAQRPAVQRFLLDTCVVDELSPSLARALSPDDGVTLLDVEEANLLLRRIDDDGSSFRFHHLLIDLLRFRLESDAPEHHVELHRRAAAWYAEHDRPVEACRHAWRVGDHSLALEIMDETVLDVSYRAAPLEELERSLRDVDVVRAPGPSLSLALALVTAGRVAAADRLVARVEPTLSVAASREVGPQLVAVRAIVDLLLGDTARAASGAEAIEFDGVDDTWPLMATETVAKAEIWEGRPDSAIVRLRRALPRCDLALTRMEALGTIAHAHLAAGDLDAATELASTVLAEVDLDGGAYTDGVLARAVLGAVELERGDTARADALLRSAATAATPVRIPALVLAQVGLSRAWASEGDLPAAWLAVSAAYEAMVPPRSDSAIVDHVRAQEVRLLLGIGDLDGAATIIELMRPAAARRLLEAELALAAGHLDVVRRVLDVRAAGLQTHRAALETALLRTKLATATGDGVDAAVGEVLDLSERGGFILMLAEAGVDVLSAIRAGARRRPLGPHVEALLRLRPPVSAPAPSRPDVEVLTEREQAVVRYMATSLSYREIAEELIVSVNTIKTHVKHINQKLGASSRSDAVQRARELNYI